MRLFFLVFWRVGVMCSVRYCGGIVNDLPMFSFHISYASTVGMLPAQPTPPQPAS